MLAGKVAGSEACLSREGHPRKWGWGVHEGGGRGDACMKQNLDSALATEKTHRGEEIFVSLQEQMCVSECADNERIATVPVLLLLDAPLPVRRVWSCLVWVLLGLKADAAHAEWFENSHLSAVRWSKIECSRASNPALLYRDRVSKRPCGPCRTTRSAASAGIYSVARVDGGVGVSNWNTSAGSL